MKKIILTSLFLMTIFSLQAQIRYGVRSQETKPEEINVIDLSYTNPKTYEIESIGVVGANILDSAILGNLAGLNVGDKITIPGEQISRATKKLWDQGFLDDVGIYVTDAVGDKVSLIIYIAERGTVNRVNWVGVTKTEQSELIEKVNLIGKVPTNSLIKNSELIIKKHFDEKGFLNATIRTELERDTVMRSRDRLTFIIDKKQKVNIKDIHIVGNDEFDSRRLKGQMKGTNEKVRFHLVGNLIKGITQLTPKKVANFFTKREKMEFEVAKNYIYDNVKLNIFGGSKFVDNKFREDKDKVIAFYNARGFRDATIVQDSVYKSGESTLDVLLRIDEGNRYYFGDVKWVGNYVHTDEELAAILGVQRGDIYNQELLDRKLNFDPQEDVASLYMDNGYLFFQANPAEVRVENDTIDLEIRMFEGPQATINKVIIAGNDRTNDHVVIRELFTRPGEKFSRSNIIRTQSELSALGYFNPETINPRPIPNQNDGTVDIAWDLEEAPSDQIELSGGWGGIFGFVGTVGLRFNNFSTKNLTKPSTWRPLPVGDGQSLGLRIQANGRRFQSYSFDFSEPWLGGKKPNAFSFNLNRSIQRNIDFVTNQQLGSFKVSSATVGLGRRVKWPDNFFQIQNSVTYMVYDVNNFGSLLGFDNGLSNNITFNTVISRNSIANPRFPQFGGSVMLTANLTPPYSVFNKDKVYSDLEPAEQFRWVEYHKWMFDASFFIPLPAKFVLMAKTNLGFIGQYNNRTGFSPFERFIMGGSGLAGQQGFILAQEIIALRGYDDNTIQPVDQQTNFRGGIMYNKFTMEVRYPVSMNPQASIYLLGFAEGGNTFNNYQEYNPFNLYRSAGVGARVFMPAFGLLGVDWGYGFDRLPGSTTPSGAQVHFTIGQQFR
ncbi:outer membrane protein assembly factor [Fulvivirgaceae bacterium LMO-SS25]